MIYNTLFPGELKEFAQEGLKYKRQNRENRDLKGDFDMI